MELSNSKSAYLNIYRTITTRLLVELLPLKQHF